MKHPMSHAQLDEKVGSLWRIGGIYEPIAIIVEHDNRDDCVGPPTGVVPPWVAAREARLAEEGRRDGR